MHTIETDLRPLHRLAVLRSVEVVDAVRPSDLDRPTPCAGWTLADLLAHMTVQHRGFAAAARGQGADESVWDVATVADAVRADPAGSYTAAAHDVLDAFAADGVMEATFALPEFGPNATFPGALAIGFHFVDYAVHGWDVAASMGARYELPDDVVTALLPLVMAIPDGDVRDAAAVPFDRAVNASAATDFEKALLHLGRQPNWRQP
ncbi:TIGR03086 family protein [Mycolicibacterium conceptionense]|uniref:TIGR03086 family protein n=1 Tax=Mycolicibacterium conceptionense TaxID=451644 RepID=A0A1A1Z231_9MYCO|nr:MULTISPECIES: TIGR03086 family metal-binding protein [Mycolicibacterium]MCW1820067.1 TIGR03086 family metal-binding protein [Mycolicibacterium senegalense]OBB07823.1 TIGR03086 family protein [Mycolicibacterium conceptionense]OBE96760.1 TIGR03086 family protein [Mycolicibacterium conceptionense]OBF16034.1 TIGR03086 family protein [Mycolicibacterium conceptionense]OBF37625.1 TIGR03086 family protein [Mycolicibacterium conceptionense]